MSYFRALTAPFNATFMNWIELIKYDIENVPQLANVDLEKCNNESFERVKKKK